MRNFNLKSRFPRPKLKLKPYVFHPSLHIEATLFIIFSGDEYHLKQTMSRSGLDFHLQELEQDEEHFLWRRKEIRDKRRAEC
jgi:hypothetical protein